MNAKYVLLTLTVGGCSLVEPVCPASEADLESPEFVAGMPSRAVIGTATVSRFVDSDDRDYRGYDISLIRRMRGLTDHAIASLFVRSSDVHFPVEAGDEVLYIGAIGDQPQLLIPVTECSTLIPWNRPSPPPPLMSRWCSPVSFVVRQAIGWLFDTEK